MKLRELERDQRRARLTEAEQAGAILDQQQEELAQLEQQVHQSRREAATPSGLDVTRLLSAGRYQLLLEAQGRTVEDQRKLLQQELEKRRGAVVEANRNVKTLRKLNEREEQVRREQDQRREVRQLDELATQTYHRNRTR